MGVHDGQIMPVTQTEWEEDAPAWSPDGTKLAYLLNRAGNVELTVKTLASGRTTTIDTGPGVALEFFPPQFTVDGLDYTVEEWKPFELADQRYRWLLYGKEK